MRIAPGVGRPMGCQGEVPTCVCVPPGVGGPMGGPGMVPILVHKVRAHEPTGRGEILISLGDVEQNPGPNRSGPSSSTNLWLVVNRFIEAWTFSSFFLIDDEPLRKPDLAPCVIGTLKNFGSLSLVAAMRCFYFARMV